MGGLAEKWDSWNEQIVVVEFGEANPHRSELCGSCLQRVAQTEKEEKAFPRRLILSCGFFYNIALEIRHPFQAIMLLRDCANYLEAGMFRFAAVRSKG